PQVFNIRPYLDFSNDRLEIKYEESEQTKLLRESRKFKNRVKTEYISKGVLKATFKNISENSNKINLATNLVEIADLVLSSKETKGIYIYGKTGIGKTYLMGSLYNYL
ncbi:prepilin peptidase, partial [Streptococcus danieliae]|nr:prepilin peptidase [Streptococcus danieliae]